MHYLPLREWDLRSDGELLLGALNSDLTSELTSLAVDLDSLQQETLLHICEESKNINLLKKLAF